MKTRLLILTVMLSFGAGLYGCADDIDARGSKVDTDTNMDTDDGDEGAAGAAGGNATDDEAECAAACDNDECVAACSE